MTSCVYRDVERISGLILEGGRVEVKETIDCGGGESTSSK